MERYVTTLDANERRNYGLEDASIEAQVNLR